MGDFPELATPGVAARVVQIRNPATGMTFGLPDQPSAGAITLLT